MEDKHLKLKHPYTCMVAGPTSSGKTILVRRLLKHYKILTYFKIPIIELTVLWAYGQWQSLYTVPIADVKVQYIPGLPSQQEIQDCSPQLIVIDDLMTELGSNKSLADLFTKGSHHMGISVLFISQNMFHQGSQMRTIGLNCHYYILMKNPRDKAQIAHFARSVFPGKSKALVEAYEDATNEEYGYIMIDLTQQTPDNLRVRTKITPEDSGAVGYEFAPVVYVF